MKFTILISSLLFGFSAVQAQSILLSEGFEGASMDPRISVISTNNFTTNPGVVAMAQFGSAHAFGFGISACGAGCFWSYQTALCITFPSPTYVTTVSFKEMELYGNWGSTGYATINGPVLVGTNIIPPSDNQGIWGRTPQNDGQADNTYRTHTYTVNANVTTIYLTSSDISEPSELFMDDLVISGKCSPLTVSISSNKPLTFCKGDSVTLVATPSGMSYQWHKNGNVIPGAKLQTLNVSSSGTFAALVTNSSGCSDSTSVVVVVNPTPVAAIAGTNSLCPGGSLTLKASPAGMRYKWLKNSQPQPGTTDSLPVSDSGIYSVIVTNASDCSDSTAVSISVNPVPVAVITGTPSFCAGSSGILRASPAGMSYQWEKNALLQPVITDTIIVSDSGIYSVIVSNGSCSDSISVRVTINPVPVAGISGPASFCTGQSEVLKASPVGLTYKWMKNGQSQSATGDSLTVSDSGIYSVVATNSSGCSDSTSVSVSVNPLPVAAIAGPLSLCAGDSTLLKASPAGLRYQWEKDGQLEPSSADSLTVTKSGTYSVIVSNASNCSDSTSVSVSVNPSPVAGISGSLSFCEGNSTVLKASPAGLSYQWKKNGQQQSNTMDTFVVADSGDYSLIVSNSNGCSGSTTVHVVVNSLPVVSIAGTDTVTSTGTILITTRAVSYLWSTGDTTQTISASNAGSYFVTVTDTNGCSSTSPVFDFAPRCGEELLLEALEGKAITIDKIIPNPAHDAFTVSFTNPNASPIHFEIDDVLGRILASGETTESQLSLSARELPEGVLLLCAKSNGFVQTRRFVVAR